MKFGKEWKERLLLLPISLHKQVYSYKKWKTKSKKYKYSTNYIIKKIKREFIKFHIFFIEECKKTILRKISCFGTTYYNIDLLLELYNFNKITFFKICKRLDKRLNVDIFKKLNQTLLKNKIEQFWIKRLKMENNTIDIEPCPICFEDYTINNPSIITSCGHIFCANCFYKMTNAYKLYGNIINIINFNYANNTNNYDCPICRNKKPFINFSKYNIFPIEYSNNVLELYSRK